MASAGATGKATKQPPVATNVTALPKISELERCGPAIEKMKLSITPVRASHFHEPLLGAQPSPKFAPRLVGNPLEKSGRPFAGAADLIRKLKEPDLTAIAAS